MKKMGLGSEVEDGDLHRLRSDLSSLLHQIDELVVRAIEVNNNNNVKKKKNGISKDDKTQIESFSRVLSDMLSSLKSWVPKFQIALHTEEETDSYDDESRASDSPEETTLSLVSPSPLVSWRANCTVKRGRQMFMLTPLPLSSKHHKQPNPQFPPSTLATSFMDNVAVKPTPIKHQLSNNQDKGSMLLVMTPCLKMSPPKSCLLLEPISEMKHLGDHQFRKGTPYPVGMRYSDSESSGVDDSSPDLSLKYPELLGICRDSKAGIGNKTVEASPDWFTSPPKTCVLMEPPDDNIDDRLCVHVAANLLNQQVGKCKDGDGGDVCKDHSNRDNFVGSLDHVENTPIPESSFQTGKRPGENTLKRELWTKFEAASAWGCQPKLPTDQKNAHKGFLDLLEEASCDE
ncbi:uncharacterized protein LOC106773807 [Vigna radiata var. radiata]|uniref:Uncharacterized protein LOC106773807 n=1 Tax=Vigna radiata var. radiata TaxID=3916 RepID=A0A1S3VCG5_VIGRR|nr:uncharacterized protein LOC106773807 [Vigna radiata var. radiata]